MIKYNYSDDLIKKIKEYNIFLENEDFRLALHEIYLSKNHIKIAELSDALTHYYFKKEKFKDYLKAFERSSKNLNYFSKSADEFYNFKNKEIQEFYKNSMEEICSNLN